MLHARLAVTKEDFEIGKTLFRAYAKELAVDLSFQDFEKELVGIQAQYGPPDGCLLIAYSQQEIPMACVGIRKLEVGVCELKRMYIEGEFRGMGLGDQLLKTAIQLGKELGYKYMRLDTLPSMHAAIALYIKNGFYEIGAYRYNPIDGTKYLERLL